MRRLLKSVVSAGKLFHILITLVLKKPRLTELTNLGLYGLIMAAQMRLISHSKQHITVNTYNTEQYFIDKWQVWPSPPQLHTLEI